MNLILILKELWQRKLLVAAAILLAAALSILAVFQVSLAPPSISKRTESSARGSIAILVDSTRSPIADAQRDLAGLTARAAVFARYMAGGDVIGRIARANGISARQIDVVGPVTPPSEGPGAEGESLQIHPYGIEITSAEELPVVNVLTRAPTVAEARGLAAASPKAIREVVHSIQEQQQTPLRKRVEFRVLGPAQAAPVSDALGKKVALALFVVLVAIFLLAILGVPRFMAAWRGVEAEAAPGGGEPAPDPDVVRLPAGRGERRAEEPGAAGRVAPRREP